MRQCAFVCTLLLLCGTALADVPQTDGTHTDAVFDHPTSAAQLLKSTLAVPAAELSKAAVLTGTFIQKRQLAEIARPLSSRGDFLLSRAEGLYWHTAAPFDSKFILTRQGMVLRQEAAGAAKTATREQPALRMALEIFFALFALDVTQLERHFDLFSRPTPAGWEVGLRPKKSSLATVFKQAVVKGNRQVERIELTGAEGDLTQIELSDLTTRATGLTPEEQKHFRP